MLRISELKERTVKSEYLNANPIEDTRLSKAKQDAGWGIPDLYGLARSGDASRLRRMLKQVIAAEKKSAAVDRRCTTTGRALLHEAASFGKVSVVELLLGEFNADVHARTLLGADTPLHLAAAKNFRNVCFIMMTKFGADPNGVNKMSSTPVHYAGLYGNLATVKTLMRYGGKASLKDCDGKTPAALAFSRGGLNQDMVDYFLLLAQTEAKESYLTDLVGKRREAEAEKEEQASLRAAERKATFDEFSEAVVADYTSWRRPHIAPGVLTHPKFRHQY